MSNAASGADAIRAAESRGATPTAAQTESTRHDATTAEGDDYARFEIETPFAARWLLDFFADPLRLLRINPFLTLHAVERIAPDRLRLRGRNDALERDFEVTARIERLPDGWRLLWDGWLKNETRFIVRPPTTATTADATDTPGARIILIDDYSATPEAERRQRLDEVDTSTAAWAQHIHAWLHGLHRYRWLPGHRWFMTGPWLNMKPAARRISKWVAFITIAEFVFFLMVFAIFWLEYGR